MRRLQTIMVFVGLLTVIIAVALFLDGRKSQAQSQAELAQVRASLAENQAALKLSVETSAALELKLQEVAGVLAVTTDKLQQSSQASDQAGAAAGTNAVAPVRAQVSAWKQFQNTFFKKVMASDGRELATGATFAGMSGRRLIFRPAQGPPLSVDVDQVHPDILALLGIKPDEARQAQYELDQQKAAHAEAAQKAYQDKIAAIRRLMEQKAARDRDLAREAKERQVVQEQRALKLEALDIERQKAQAALKQADAAMVKAMNAVPIFIGTTFGGTPDVSTSTPNTPAQGNTAPSAPLNQAHQQGANNSFRFLPAAPTLQNQPLLPQK